VPKSEYAKRDLYDLWLPDLAPSEGLLQQAHQAADERSWRRFTQRYRVEMKRPEASRLLDLLAALSHQTNFAMGCYCEDEGHCHRSMLRDLLLDRGAALV
jgi:uncharacterized protein YeaO (DUF488 family)